MRNTEWCEGWSDCLASCRSWVRVQPFVFYFSLSVSSPFGEIKKGVWQEKKGQQKRGRCCWRMRWWAGWTSGDISQGLPPHQWEKKKKKKKKKEDGKEQKKKKRKEDGKKQKKKKKKEVLLCQV